MIVLDENLTNILLMTRILGYLLNAALLVAVVIKFPHHRLIAFVWIVLLLLLATSAFLRFSSTLDNMILVIDVFVTPIVYLSAIAIALTYLKYEPKKHE